MCGIIGYVGYREAAPILLEGLRRLEYRGYDSAGVAIQNGQGLNVRKLAGRVQGLSDSLAEMALEGTGGIAHTRWATHGAPTQANAHPHTDCSGSIVLVHNGIIENADVLRKQPGAPSPARDSGSGMVPQSVFDTPMIKAAPELPRAAESWRLNVVLMTGLALASWTGISLPPPLVPKQMAMQWFELRIPVKAVGAPFA